MSAHTENAAIAAGRLFSASVDSDEDCAVCGERLHPYPEPEYWMQYPLPQCSLIDGVKVCSSDYPHWKECLPKFLATHPTMSASQQMELFE